MDEITRNVLKTFDRVSVRVRYLLVLTALVAVAAVGYTFLPEAEVSAQGREETAKTGVEAPEVPTQRMLDFALNLHTASEYTVYAERGITDRGSSTVRGTKDDAVRSEAGRKSTKDLSNSIDAIRQLPCTEVRSSDLTGKSFNPGVYCLNSAELNGEMTLDSANDTTGLYVFRVAGSLNAKSGSSIRLENGAQGGNVFFVAEDAEIGDNASFRANILTKGNTRIGTGATVTDKVLSLGKVEMNDSVLLGGTTATMEICKEQQLPVSAANSLANQIFHFVISGSVYTAANPLRVPVGSCSSAFDVTAGPQTVTELNTGTLVTPTNGTFTGNFELIEVRNLTLASTSTLGLVNLATRVANVTIVAGGVNTQLKLQFTNRRTITGFIEICKRAATGVPGNPSSPFNPRGANPLSGGDADVTGFYQYTIQGVYTVNQQNPEVQVLQIFTVPAGQCSGPIVVSGGTPPAPGNPKRSSVIVTELGRSGFFVESTEIIPGDRLSYGPELGQGVNSDSSLFHNPGGAFVEVTYLESNSEIDETLIVFSNRSNPGRLKVCKIAGPGIPINTLFRFTVTGIGATNAAAPQFTSYGPVTKTFDLRAGDPAQGGSCDFVQGFGANAPGYNQFQTFVNGTPVFVVENGISPNNTVPQNVGQLRASRIRQFGSAFTNTAIAGFSPNPDLVPGADYVARAAVFARASVVEVEFVNFRFNPDVLKVCKIAGNSSLLGVSFNFTIALVSPVSGDGVPLFPSFSQTVSVTAGDAAQGGGCTFVSGSALQGGTFNQGSTITITEAASSSYVSSVTCPTCGIGGLTIDLPARRATLSGPNGLLPGINAVTFTNLAIICRSGKDVRESRTAGQPADLSRPECSRDTRYDFDGDRKADPAIFTPSDGRWTIAWSNNNYQYGPGVVFGAGTDKPVPADYDGDGKTDVAVWRPSTGEWFFLGTTNVYETHQWGQDGDIPLVGDYNGDGKSDFAVWRPSNATMYIRHSSQTFRTFQFGLSADKPYARDFDGDGLTDLAMFRNGTWYLQNSGTGFRVYQFGQTGDTPVPADYDGDGAADLAIYRGGTWYTLSATAYTVRQYGSATDIPVPADYNGDGKADPAYFRPSTGIWHLGRLIPGGIVEELTVALGTATDIPLQSLQ